MKIKAAVTRAKAAPLSIETIDLEEPRAGEILVRLVATGVCQTDLAMRDQVFPVPQPIVLGHEGAGIVERVGSGLTKVTAGDHVVMTYNSCGHCPSYLEHEPTYCYDFFGYTFGGSRPDGSSALSKDEQPIHGNFFGQSSLPVRCATNAMLSKSRTMRRLNCWGRWRAACRQARARSSTRYAWARAGLWLSLGQVLWG